MTTFNMTNKLLGSLELPGANDNTVNISEAFNTVNIYGLVSVDLTEDQFTNDTVNIADLSTWLGGISGDGIGETTHINGERATWFNTHSDIGAGTIDVGQIKGVVGEIVHNSWRKNPGKLTFMHNTEVSAGQTLSIGGGDPFGLGGPTKGDVELQSPLLFHGTVKLGFGQLELDGIHANAWHWLPNDMLAIRTGSHVVDTIHLVLAQPSDGLGTPTRLVLSQTAHSLNIHADGAAFDAGGVTLPMHM